MSEIVAAFAVYGGTVVEFELDVDGMTDAQIAAAVEEASGGHLDTSLCHECSHNISDPQAEEMVGLTVDGRDIDLDESATQVTLTRAEHEGLVGEIDLLRRQVEVMAKALQLDADDLKRALAKEAAPGGAA